MNNTPNSQNSQNSEVDNDSVEMKMPEANQAPRQKGQIPERQFGIILWILVGVLVVMLIGLYAWYRTLTPTASAPAPTPDRPTAAENREPESTTAVAQTRAFAAMSSSDELDAIAADLESTDLASLTQEAPTIEAELERANR